MKKSALTTTISILLIVACVFALAAAGFGVKDGLAIKQYKEDDAKAADVVGELEKAIQALKENEAAYNEGVGTYAKGLSDYAAGQQAYNEGKATLAQGYKDYNDGKATLEQGYRDYEAGKKALEEGRLKIAEGQKMIDENTDAYNEGKALLSKIEPLMPLLNTYVKFRDGSIAKLPGFDSAQAWFVGKVAPLAERMGLKIPADVTDFPAYIQRMVAEGQAMLKQYEDGLKELEAGKAELAAGEQQLAEAEKQLAQGEKDLAEGKKALENGEQELAAGAKELADGAAQLAALLPRAHHLRQELEVRPPAVEQVLFAVGDELGREKPRQQLQRHARVDHAEQLLIQPDQHLHRVHPRIDAPAQLLVLLVEQHRQRPQQCVLSLKIVVKGAPGGAGCLDDLLHRGILISLLVKQLPGGAYDLGPGRSGILLCHSNHSTIGLVIRPIPSISQVTTSPVFKNFGGSNPIPTPAGVPIAMIVPA